MRNAYNYRHFMLSWSLKKKKKQEQKLEKEKKGKWKVATFSSVPSSIPFYSLRFARPKVWGVRVNYIHLPCMFHHKEPKISQQIIKCSPIWRIPIESWKSGGGGGDGVLSGKSRIHPKTYFCFSGHFSDVGVSYQLPIHNAIRLHNWPGKGIPKCFIP